MVQQQIGLISPRDARTAVLEDQQSGSIDVGMVLFEGTRITAGDYLSRFPATTFVPFARKEELEEARRRLESQAYALDFALMLFDHELSDRLKRDIARELDELLESPENEEYSLDILLAHAMTENIRQDTLVLSPE